jgi:hypothetical protein
MKMIDQFPDNTRRLRLQRTQEQRKPGSHLHLLSREAVTKYHEGEFRKWHIKLVLIITFVMVFLSFLALQAPGFFRWLIE